MLEYRQLGGHIDVRTGLTGPDGSVRTWSPPKEVWHRFQDLCGGMYAEGGHLAREYLEEQGEFPRSEEYMPAWYRAKLAEAE